MRILLPFLLFVVFVPSLACAISIKGKLPDGMQEVVAIPANTTSSKGIASSSATNFKMKPKGKQRMGFLNQSNAFLPVVFAVKIGKRVLPVAVAQRKGLCSRGGTRGIMAIKKSIKRGKFEIKEIDGEEAYAILKKFANKRGLKNNAALKRLINLKSIASLNSDCSPVGNAANLGIGSLGAQNVRARAAADDEDADGLPDAVDSDHDGDGVLNPYDEDFVSSANTFYLFSNLKVGLEQVRNSDTGVTPTDQEIDDLLRSTTTLAIEVKADASLGETSELDCGSLGYCTTGGTGSVAGGGGGAFPGPLGGTLDPDSDGHGTITKGGTDDFQLQTGAVAADINAGDSFIQEVTSGASVSKFFKKLDFVFKGTPAIETIVINPGTASETTQNFSYPIASGSPGTMGNCLTANPDGSGNINLQLTAWRPQRKGIPALGEAQFVDIGLSDITVDIPNEPCTIGSGCSAPRMPNNCTSVTYSESDPNLSITGGKLLDTKADADADPANTVTFTVDLKACLAESGDVLDAGEEVSLDLQFRSVSSMGGSDNSAVQFCVQRTT